MKDQEIITRRVEIENFLKEFDTRFDSGNIPLAAYALGQATASIIALINVINRRSQEKERDIS
jgi:hypothetical protein